MTLDRYKHRLFGRTRGRSNKKINIEKYFEFLNKFRITNLSVSKKYILDIGSGYGETTIYLSKQYPRYTVISCEKYIDGNLNLLKKINTEKITNIRIHPGNVHNLLDNNNNKNYFELVWIFFPDPWPKKKHFKRRLITKEFLIKLYSFMKKNSKIFIVTDSISYSRFILNNIYKVKKYYKFFNQNYLHLNYRNICDIETKFYKKAIISGKNPSLFILERI